MATVSGITAARMLAIDAQSIVDGDIVGSDLILTRRNATTINAGNVRGISGDSAALTVELGTAVDLNTIITPGTYAQSQNVDAAAGTNYPVPWAGLLSVATNPGATMIWQTYKVYNGGVFAGSEWTRTWYNNAWTVWSGRSGGQNWTNLTLITGWSAYGSGYQTPQYRVEGSFVKLRGLARCTAALTASDTICNIGTTIAPKLREIFNVTTSQILTTGPASAGTAHTHTLMNYAGRLDVTNTGDVIISASATAPIAVNGWVSLDGVYWDWTS